MRKRKITRQFKKFRIFKDLYEKPSKREWVAKVVFLTQMPLTFSSRCKRYFLPYFNVLFQLVRTKCFNCELFSCLPKVDHVIKSCKEPVRVRYLLHSDWLKT